MAVDSERRRRNVVVEPRPTRARSHHAQEPGGWLPHARLLVEELVEEPALPRRLAEEDQLPWERRRT